MRGELAANGHSSAPVAHASSTGDNSPFQTNAAVDMSGDGSNAGGEFDQRASGSTPSREAAATTPAGNTDDAVREPSAADRQARTPWEVLQPLGDEQKQGTLQRGGSGHDSGILTGRKVPHSRYIAPRHRIHCSH